MPSGYMVVRALHASIRPSARAISQQQRCATRGHGLICDSGVICNCFSRRESAEILTLSVESLKMRIEESYAWGHWNRHYRRRILGTESHPEFLGGRTVPAY